jgi:hypothetical protein
MPNWCSNVATINNGNSELIDAIENELKKPKDDVALFQSLRPRPADQEEDWYGWNTGHWGTKWDASIYDYERLDENNIRINFDTAWAPPVALYDYLFEEGYDTTAYYDECGMGFCGKYEFGMDDHYDYTDMDSDTVRDTIPTDLDEMFNISEQMADREAEDADDANEEDDEEDSEPTYTMTDWFSFLTKPVHVGWYEVKTTSWPFPHRMEWSGTKWVSAEEVTEWRGITQEEHDLYVMLDNLKVEFDKQLEGE